MNFFQKVHKKAIVNGGELSFLLHKALGTPDHTNIWKGKRPIFFVSTGRTGTKFMARFFSDNFKDIHADHEPFPDVFPIAMDYFRNRISHEKAKFLFEHFRKSTIHKLDRQGIEVYIESNPRLGFMLPVIKELGGDVKIVHIVRNCIGYVRSGFSKEATIKGKTIKVRSASDPRSRITAKDLPEDPYYDRWDKMNRFERNCWFWQKKNRIIQQELKDFPNSKTFFYEDLFDPGKAEESWERLIDFLELQEKANEDMDIKGYLQENVVNKNKTYELGDWKEWPKEYQESLLRIAGEHMRTLGYETPPS